MKIYLVRHAQTEANRDGIIQGQKNTPVTENGLIIAKKMATFFAGQKIDCIYSSPLDRAMCTANLIAYESGFNAQNIVTLNTLMEIDLKPWVYQKIDSLDDSNAESSYKTYKTKPSKFKPLCGESVVDVQARMARTYNNIVSNDIMANNIVIVSHSMAIRSLLTYIEGKSIDDVWAYYIPPVSIIEIDYDGIKSKVLRIITTEQ